MMLQTFCVHRTTVGTGTRHELFFLLGGTVPIFHPMLCLGCRPSWPHNDAEDFVGCLLLLLWSHSYAVLPTLPVCATAGDRLQALVKEACELMSRVDALSVCVGKWPPTSICGCLVQPTALCVLEVFSCSFKISFLITYVIFLTFFSFTFPLSV